MKTGRNQPCPCGSGIKYKKCCLLKGGPAQNANVGSALEGVTVEHRKSIENILRSAVELLASVAKHGMSIREKSKTGYGRLLDAHMLATGVLGHALKRKNLIPGKSDESISSRLLLMATFVQGISICETAISEGLYAQAAALQKQELETIAALEEYAKGTRKDGKTPNVKNSNVNWGLSTLYGPLNELAHVAKTDILNSLYGAEQQGKAIPVTAVPIYVKEISRSLYAAHVALIIQMALQVDAIHTDMYGDPLVEEEKLSLYVACEHLKAEGFLQGPSVEPGSPGQSTPSPDTVPPTPGRHGSVAGADASVPGVTPST